MKDDPRNIGLPFFISIGGIFLILTAPTLFTKSMFMDGLYYSSIARNMAEGLGSFWHPHFTQTHHSTFHEHPPLAIGLESLFFRLFGSAFWVERCYSLLSYLLTGWTLVSIWKRSSGNAFSRLNWLPLLFGISIPLMFWGPSNNVLENTMMLFTLLAVHFFLNGQHGQRSMNIALGGLMVAAGFLCKGPVALFPLSFFFWSFCFNNSLSFLSMVQDTLLALAFSLLPILLILAFSEPASIALEDYLLNQVLHGVQERETVDSRFFIADRLFDQLIPALLILGIGIAMAKWKKKAEVRTGPEDRKRAFLFLAIGLSGVLPIMVSKTQGAFYMIPALPFFCLGFATLLAPYLQPFLLDLARKKGGSRILWGSGAFLSILAIGLHIHFFGKLGEDGKKIQLVEKVEKETDASLISIDPNIWANFGLHAYFQRYAGISLDGTKNAFHEILLLPGKGARIKEIPSSYERIPLEDHKFRLYKKEEGFSTSFFNDRLPEVRQSQMAMGRISIAAKFEALSDGKPDIRPSME